MKTTLLIVALFLPFTVFAQATDKDQAGGGMRWNITGPQWHDTECGLIGFAAGVGVGEDKWVKPCSIPVRVCEYKGLTVNAVALPDPGCGIYKGELVRTYLRTW